MLDTPKMSTEEVKSLIDLSAMVTGKYIPCGEIEQYYPPLDEALLKKVRYLENRIRQCMLIHR